VSAHVEHGVVVAKVSRTSHLHVSQQMLLYGEQVTPLEVAIVTITPVTERCASVRYLAARGTSGSDIEDDELSQVGLGGDGAERVLPVHRSGNLDHCTDQGVAPR
jgi:hypothetical protein